MSRTELAVTPQAYAPDMTSIKAIDAEWQSCAYNPNLTRHLFITIDCSLTATFALDKIYEIQLATTSGISLGSSDSMGIYASTLRSLIGRLGGDPNAVEKNPLIIGDFFLIKKRMRLFLEQQNDLKKHNPAFIIITPSQMTHIRDNRDDRALRSFYEKIKINHSTAIIKFEETRGKGNIFLSDASRYKEYEQFKQYFIEMWTSSVTHRSAVVSRENSFDSDDAIDTGDVIDIVDVVSLVDIIPTSGDIFLLEECSNASMENNTATTYRIAILATVMPGADEMHSQIHTAFMPIRGEIHTGYDSHHPIYWESFFDKLQYFYDTKGRLIHFNSLNSSQNQKQQNIQTNEALKLQLETLTSRIVQHCHENHIKLNRPFTIMAKSHEDIQQHFLFPCSECACSPQEYYTQNAFNHLNWRFFNSELKRSLSENELINLYAAIPEHQKADFFSRGNFERIYSFVREIFSVIGNEMRGIFSDINIESTMRAYTQFYLDNPDEFKKTLDSVIIERRTMISAAATQSSGLLASHKVIDISKKSASFDITKKH